jgi:ribosomal protein S18 acetylase RimI-like enzyme
MTMPIQFERLDSPTPIQLEQIQAIYEDSFPPSEREPFADIAASMADQSLMMRVAREGDESARVMGFALVTTLPDVKLAYLPYFATHRDSRNQGVGARLFRFMVDDLARMGEWRALIWEVEPPNPDDPGDVKNRRIGFYERLGGRLITSAASYCMPDYETGGVVPLRLMWLPLDDDDDDWPETPTKSTVIAWIKSLYAHDYPGYSALCDAIIAGMDH